MAKLTQARSTNNSYSPATIPTAVFVGGTSGIGQGMAEAFARVTNGNANIIIVGRNQAAAERIISSFPKPGPGVAAKHEFVQCDVSLLKNVHATTSALLSRLDKINFLVVSCGYLSLGGRNDTVEGHAHKLVVVYYARWAFVNALLPLLSKAKDAGEEAKVMSVLAAGMSFTAPADVNDLGMVKTYSGYRSTLIMPTYNDLMLKKFASLYPDITFVHTYPGEVFTQILMPTTFPSILLKPLVYIFLWPITVTKETCAEYMWYALHNSGPGFHRCGSNGDDIGYKHYYGTEEALDKLWVHTQEVVNSKAD